MGYRSTKQCVLDLQKHGHLIELNEPVSATLQLAEIQRRVFASGGPAVLFRSVDNCSFPMVSNMFGTIDRARFMFRDTIENVRRAIELKIDPTAFFKKPTRYLKAPFTAMAMRPKLVRNGRSLANEVNLDQLPQLVSWPNDAGGFVTLPQVYTEDARQPGLKSSNLGMYRIQLSGNRYKENCEVGLHYQIHRSIGVHHTAANELNQPFHVNVSVGGSPAMTLAAVMPMPEGMSELTFAGALAGYRIPMARQTDGLPVYADADFCITGKVIPEKLLPEGPFGDHLGYYSLAHDFPVLAVDKVYHRDDAIWPFTVVGRPPQEDTIFGELIHELTGPIIPTVLPGVKAVHAVDASGVHPLLLAVGSERYVPYQDTTAPKEILTQANAILGQGQLSLAKYLCIIDHSSCPDVDIHDIDSFLTEVLRRIDLQRDLHFQTCTTIDTLDYTGTGLNTGSKLVMAAAGPPIRQLDQAIPTSLTLVDGFRDPRVMIPGILVVEGPSFDQDSREATLSKFASSLASQQVGGFPLIVLVNDSEFAAANLNNFLWVTFTRSDPASDIFGVDSSVRDKHWGCRGNMIIDARIKPHHAPPLIEDPETTAFVDALASRGLPISKYL